MAATPAVSVVVATRDRDELLARTLESLAAQTVAADRFELIVVDDASSPGTARLLQRWTEQAKLPTRVLRRERPGGPAAARNTGWRAARAPLVAFTDDDCEPRPGWLQGLLDAAGRHPAEPLQGPTLPSGRDRRGPFTRTIDSRSLGPWFPMSNMAFPRDLLERLGGFDEALKRGEDTDLAWRAIELGAVPRWAENAVVEHAIRDAGPAGLLRTAWDWSPIVRNFARYEGLRRALYLGVFWKREHAQLVVALAALALARRVPPALLLCLPYLRQLRARTIASQAGQATMPFYALHDLVEVAAMIRGSISARKLVL